MRQTFRLLFVFVLLASFVVATPSAALAQDPPVLPDTCASPATGSLRQQVEQFNAMGTGDLTIDLETAIYDLQCELVITNTEHTLTLNSAGATTLQGGEGFRVFNVAEGATLVLDGVTITEGSVSGNGGGILNHGTLTMLNSTISGNSATSHGGGIYSFGTVHLTDESVISGNTGTNGGGILSDHGSTLTVDDGSVVSDNIARGNGGGIYSRATLHIADSTLVSNDSGTDGNGIGGGIVIVNDDIDGITVRSTITAATIAGNEAVEGGGVNIQGGNAQVSITNVTISGNIASQDGGGITIRHEEPTVDIRSTTISGNVATIGTGINKEQGELTLAGSIVAGNTLPDLTTEANIRGGIDVDGGHNFIDGDPLLQPLANNGGPTETMLPQEGSPVINAGGDDCLATDQRGFTRPSGSACDIGAVEVVQPDESPIATLIDDVRTGQFAAQAKPRLLIFLHTAERALERDQTAAACSLLSSFSDGVQSYRNAGLIPASVATELRADAAEIRDVLGCS